MSDATPAGPTGTPPTPTPSPSVPPPAGPIGPTGPSVDYVALAKLHVHRAFRWNLQTVVVEPAERAALTAAGVTSDILHRFLAWRRSLLLCVIAPLAINAGLATWDMFKGDLGAFNELGKGVFWARTLSLFALPLAAFFAQKAWTDPRGSHKVLVRGWLVGFMVPIACSLVPLEAMVKQDQMGDPQQVLGGRLVMGILSFVTLLPLALSLLPALIRATIRTKTLLPGSTVPGWLLMGAAPLNLMLWLVVFVAVNAAFGDALLMGGVALFIGAPMWYLKRSDLFVRPRVGGEVNAIGAVQKTVVTMMGIGIALIIVYMFSHKIGGRTIVGTNADTSLVRPWDLDLIKFVFDYLARSLFMTAFFADILLRVNAAVHAEQTSGDDAAMRDHVEAMNEVSRGVPALRLTWGKPG